MANFLMNTWYGLAWSEELTTAPLARTILEQKVVAFRGKDMKPIALVDRCAHRFAPLSLGTVEDGLIVCPYHSLGYGKGGGCVYNPFGDIPAAASVRAYPVVEKQQMIWIWPGDPALANPATIPDFGFHDLNADDPEDWVVFGYTHMKSNYEIETDNLLDLSHIESLHRSTFGGRGYTLQNKLQIHDFGETIYANRWMPNIYIHDPVTGLRTEQRADHFLDMRWTAPSALRLHVSFTEVGKYADRADTIRDDLPGQLSAHILTPETESTTHYFWSGNHPTDFSSGMRKDDAKALFKVAFEDEDKIVLEAVQENMPGEFWASRPVILPNDAGGVRARRRLAKMIRDEQGLAADKGAVPFHVAADA